MTLGASVTGLDSDDTLGTVTITGLPTDLSSFNGGTYSGTTWTGTATQFNALSFHTGEDHAAATLTIRESNSEGPGATSSETYTLTINPVAEPPVFGGATSGSANESTPSSTVTMTLGASVTGLDSDDTLGTVTITGLPSDLSSFSGGTQSGTTWTGTTTQFNALSFHTGASGVSTLTITETNSEGSGATASETYTLTINAVAKPPIFGGSTSGSANESTPSSTVTMTLGASVTGVDSSETLGTVTITGLPTDLSSFNGGTQSGTTWTGTATQFNALSFHTGEEHSATTLTITETGVEGGVTATASEAYTLTINPVSEPPSLTLGGTAVATSSGGTVVLPSIAASAIDTDDTLTLTISGLAAGATVTNSADSSTFSTSTFTLTGAEVGSTLTVHDGTNTTSFTLTVTANNTTTGETGHSAAQTINVDLPSQVLISTVVNSRQASNGADSQVQVTFQTGAGTHILTDGSNLSTYMTINGNPGSTFATTGTEAPSFNSTNTVYTFYVHKAGNNGSSYGLTVNQGTFYNLSDTLDTNAATTTPVNFKPAGIAGDAINLGLTDQAGDGSEVTVTVMGVPVDWTVNGGTQNADGSWTVTTHDVTSLTVTTPADYAGAHVLNISEAWTTADGTAVTVSNIGSNVEAFSAGSPIYAWSQNDTLTGGAGANQFVFSNPIGHDMVNNFHVASDHIDLIGYAGIGSFADVQTHLADDGNGDAVIDLGNGQTITLHGVHAADLSADNFEFDVSTLMSNAGTMTIDDGALLPISGTIENSGTIVLGSAGGATELEVIEHGVTLEGHGQVVLSDSTGNVITGSAGDVTLTNVDNTISGAGEIGGGRMGLVNEGTIDATGANALDIDTGANTIANSGTLEATGSGGMVVHSDVANTGLLWANGGSLVMSGGVAGGSALISGSGTLEFAGASSANTAFDANSAGTLKIDDSFHFTGTVSGLNDASKIELSDVAFSASTTMSYAANADGTGGTLTVSDGVHTANIGILGQASADSFSASADSASGGTLVTHHDHLV
jgi:hypothetical protein